MALSPTRAKELIVPKPELEYYYFPFVPPDGLEPSQNLVAPSEPL